VRTEAASQNSRALAAQVLLRVSEGRALDAALAPLDAMTSTLENRDKAFVSALAHAALRHRQRLSTLLQPWLKQPPARVIQQLLLIALADLAVLQTPAHAAIDQAVEAARALKQPQCAGLVNALLRRFVREDGAAQLRALPEALEFPEWLRSRFVIAYPEQADALMQALLQPAPMWLRAAPGQRESYLVELAREAIAVSGTHPEARDAICLAEPLGVNRLPGFMLGQVSVQDPAAQLAGMLMAPKNGEDILDACAAPGGKTAHLMQLAPEAKLLAVDQDKIRLRQVGSNLLRIRRRAELAAGDAAAVLARPEFRERTFDAILLDAPCSATGVIRRHPDILQLRRSSDLTQLAGEQRRLLRALFARLKPGGRLLYATCSVLPEENDDVVADLLRHAPQARVEAIALSHGTASRFGRQWLPLPTPHCPASDGFYYCLLRSG
jgi:16S rRNA (cytosine967-C5)-methyltransferase